jgi:hypothetical protein
MTERVMSDEFEHLGKESEILRGSTAENRENFSKDIRRPIRDSII